MKRVLIFAALALASTDLSHAAQKFENSYVSFYLPDRWACRLQGTEYVCRPPLRRGVPARMLFILTAKQVGGQDTLSLYKRHLEGVAARRGVRTVTAPRVIAINDSMWVDAVLENSEVAGYVTRYLATTKGEVAVLVTYSAYRSSYASTQGIAAQAVQSLRAKRLTAKPR